MVKSMGNTRKKYGASDYVIVALVVIILFLCLLPFLHEVSISLSSERAVLSGEVAIFPVDWSIQAYRSVLKDSQMMHSIAFTVVMTAIYTFIAMALTVCCAYPLTKKRLKGRRFLIGMIIVTMYFSGGIIPDFILVNGLGIMNTMWALILPGAISAFNVILLKSFFSSSIPDSIEEAAFIDGCSDAGILVRIVLPLSTPILSCLILFYAVGKWNSFSDALFYITDHDLYPVQLLLYNLVYSTNSGEELQEGFLSDVAAESLKAACVVFATVPILIVYPWLQRYFISGIMIGSVKE